MMVTDILMPALSPTMEVGTLAKWIVKKGDIVKAGDLLAEIETDKAIMEFEAVEEGKILQLLVEEGQEDIAVNSVIAKIQGEGSSESSSDKIMEQESLSVDKHTTENRTTTKENNINKYCDNDDIVRMTKRINGGTIGLADRKKHYSHALEVLGGHIWFADDDDDEKYSLVRKGSKGDTVRRLQEALGIAADGDFGPGTESALKAWQRENDCTPDGIAGPQTLAKLF